MPITLMVGCHAQTHHITFNERADADAALASLEKRLREDRFSRNRDEDKTHRITTPAGDVVVVLEKVEVARVIDSDLHNDMVRAEREREDDRLLEKEIKWRRRIRDEFPKEEKGSG